MGFITGFLSGLTLTSSVLYLSIRIHASTRLQQSLALRDSSSLLRSVYDPEPSYVPPSARLRLGSIGDVAKDRWNGSVERAVRGVQATDWRRVREGAETWVGETWERVNNSKGGAAGGGK
ncbi:hypothetical protein IWX90DRAFT_9283 [Phyllosticta citrichinensis]|uniref:MICOS complex subunit MIC12 n=1 Tax=Phyllosticta citrichinensis TaxID=1130410 RepID=A0ABR1Y5I9_9PEZI